MENLKEFLKNVLSFTKTINPACHPRVAFSSNDETKKKLVVLEILKLAQSNIQEIVDYLSDLVGKIPWAENVSFNFHFSCPPAEIAACFDCYINRFSEIRLRSGEAIKEGISYGVEEFLL